MIAKVTYTSKLESDDNIVACDEDEEEVTHQNSEQNVDSILWDMNRPLIGDCKLELLKFDDPEAKTVGFFSFTELLLLFIYQFLTIFLLCAFPLILSNIFNDFFARYFGIHQHMC